MPKARVLITCSALDDRQQQTHPVSRNLPPTTLPVPGHTEIQQQP